MKSTVSVTLTDQQSTPLLRAETSADTTSMASVIITRATVHMSIIQLTVSAIVIVPGILCQRVKILEDITITSAVPATTTVSTVPVSLSIDAIVFLIVQPVTAEGHAGTLAVSMATCTVPDITGLPAVVHIHGEHITASTTPSIVLGK